MKNLEYIDLKYKPKQWDVVAKFFVEPNDISLKKACEHIAAESSIGTWTDIATMNPRIARKLKPKVFSIDHKTNEVKIAYPMELFEPGNMPQIYSAIAGNIFGMSAVKYLRLQDIGFPKKILDSFKGPKFGIKGVRKLLRVKKRPLIGTIVKPKVGLRPKQHANVAYDSWLGGLDIVKDDENLASMSFNSFEKRIPATLRKRDRAERETGEKKMYMANVTAPVSEMLKRAKLVKENGGEYVMIDILTCGWSALQELRDADLGMVIHAHRAGHAALTKIPVHGISMLTIAKTARLIGVDQIHIGAIFGKMFEKEKEVKMTGEEIESQIITPKKGQHLLEQKWFNVPPVFAVCSGGLYPGRVPPLIDVMGNNIIIQAGGGTHGHPQGTYSGAKAMRQAVEASLQGIKLEEYADLHLELKQALDRWGK
ncbi:type III ribulose-bisphosphate carboxylase [Candidatus Woesearchaeota archaeon]|nr:type III ribulose-bisphosphate carboxylase [Candidatus Woesearchaeota archaeon]